ncbi:hypothetical protein VB773_22785 [Haloarculaceae archaeon H-GB2-1]|nr:hypothetical protein [Haloarculaceae archaeon H-GB11]MEA5410123.1 hypothetical protein [Haloarculaceae archaeon H-GB2-1]
MLDYATNFDSRAVIPKLVGESLVDAAVARKEAEAPRQASD